MRLKEGEGDAKEDRGVIERALDEETRSSQPDSHRVYKKQEDGHQRLRSE